MHIHIAFAGISIESTLNVIRKAVPDRVVILYGTFDEKTIYKDKAEEIKKAVETMNGKCEVHRIKVLDFLNIVDAIYDVYEEYSKEPGNTFSVDITRGTNLMTAAACSTAFFTGAKVYYSQDATKVEYESLDDLVIEIPSPKIPNIQNIGEETIDILKFIEECSNNNSPVTNAEVGKRINKSTPTAKYHTDRLMESGLIKRLEPIPRSNGGDGRTKPFLITREGRFVLRWK